MQSVPKFSNPRRKPLETLETKCPRNSSQADDLHEAPEKQQSVLDALAEKVKAYQDAASMIKKKLVPQPSLVSLVM